MIERSRHAESVGTVVIAALANLVIAAAKAVAGLVSGSAAVLSEAAHSVADTATELLLFVALRRGARPADETHPFGHGRESFLWALIAAILTFVAGAGFSIIEGIRSIRGGHERQDLLITYIVLIISFIAESVSLARAARQVRRRARRWHTTPSLVVRRTPNTTVKAVFLEDSAALIGLLLAGAGLALSQLTGSPFWDGAASIAIGVLLLIVATTLARSNISLLVGQAASGPARTEIHEVLAGLSSIRQVESLLTLQLGPEDILVAATVDFGTASGAAAADAAAEATRRLTELNSAIQFVFLHPAGGTAAPAGNTAPAGDG